MTNYDTRIEQTNRSIEQVKREIKDCQSHRKMVTLLNRLSTLRRTRTHLEHRSDFEG